MKKQFGILLKSFGVILISIIISSGNSFAGYEYKYSQVVENEIEEVEESIDCDIIFHTSDLEHSGLILESTNEYSVLHYFKTIHYFYQASKKVFSLAQFGHTLGENIPIYLLNCSLIVYS